MNNNVSEVDGVKRSSQRVKAILKSYARNISILATKKNTHERYKNRIC